MPNVIPAPNLWDETTRTFDAALLRRQLTYRQMTARDLRAASGLSEGATWKAVAGKPVSRTTAAKVLRVLADRQPLRVDIVDVA